MSETPFAAYLITFMMDIVLLAGVPLAVATASGLLFSMLQAVTQVQDQTLSQTVKIAAIVTVLLAFGGVLITPLFQNTVRVFDEFGSLAR